MHKQIGTIAMVILAVGLGLGISSCGNDSAAAASDAGATGGGASDAGASGSATESPNLGDKTEKKITAADGGTVALADAGVTLDIPADALASDETISAEVVSTAGLPDGKTLAGNVIEFLPKGLEFTKPVSLSIDLGDAKLPAGATASIAWLDEKTNKWVDLDGSKLMNGTVTAEITHFTLFAIRFVVNEAGQIVQEQGQCSGDFVACGGDIEGVWTIAVGCVDVPASLGMQVASQCAGASFDLSLDITGDITIMSGTVSGTLNVESVQTTVMPKSCNDGVCDMADPMKPEETITDNGDTCEIKKTEMKVSEVDGTYTLDGNTVTVTNNVVADGGMPEAPTADEYCVTGDTLVVRAEEGNGVFIQWTATRK